MPYSQRAVAHSEGEMRRGKFDAPRIKFDLPRLKLDMPHRKLDLPRRKFDAPHRKFDLPRGKFETPRIKLDARHRKLDSPHRKFRMSRFKYATRHCTLEIRRLSGVLARKKFFPSAKMATESRSSFRQGRFTKHTRDVLHNLSLEQNKPVYCAPAICYKRSCRCGGRRSAGNPSEKQEQP